MFDDCHTEQTLAMKAVTESPELTNALLSQENYLQSIDACSACSSAQDLGHVIHGSDVHRGSHGARPARACAPYIPRIDIPSHRLSPCLYLQDEKISITASATA